MGEIPLDKCPHGSQCCYLADLVCICCHMFIPPVMNARQTVYSALIPSTKNMKLSPCEIYLLDINDAGTEIIK